MLEAAEELGNNETPNLHLIHVTSSPGILYQPYNNHLPGSKTLLHSGKVYQRFLEKYFDKNAFFQRRFLDMFVYILSLKDQNYYRENEKTFRNGWQIFSFIFQLAVSLLFKKDYSNSAKHLLRFAYNSQHPL